MSVCVSFQAYARRRLRSDPDQIWHTHVHAPCHAGGNLGGFRGSEIENVGNLPNGWTD